MVLLLLLLFFVSIVFVIYLGFGMFIMTVFIASTPRNENHSEWFLLRLYFVLIVLTFAGNIMAWKAWG